MSLYAFRNTPGRRPDGDLAFLADATAAQWARFLGCTEVVAFQPGERIVHQGGTDRAMFIVLSGRLEVVLEQSGAERRIAVLESGSIFGEQSFVDGERRSGTVRALAPGELRVLHWTSYERLSRSDPDLALQILYGIARTLSDRLRRATREHPRTGGSGDE